MAPVKVTEDDSKETRHQNASQHMHGRDHQVDHCLEQISQTNNSALSREHLEVLGQMRELRTAAQREHSMLHDKPSEGA